MTKPTIDWFEELPEPIRSTVMNDFIAQKNKNELTDSVADALIRSIAWSETFNREFYSCLHSVLSKIKDIKDLTILDIVKEMQLRSKVTINPILASKLTFEDEVKLAYYSMTQFKQNGLKQIFFEIFKTILKDEQR